MAHIDGSGRICLDVSNQLPIDGWAIVVHGRIPDELIFKSEALARTKQVVDGRYAGCGIVRVIVSGDYIERCE